ncbi:ParB/Srx family N-terminal domain-containing protein [Ralstonia syzygii subsp. celebesensis]|uniref:ParB/Srx family N-terminal domain-containing protein n=1 Tax=Ralstonia syzygii TaxID=28097 RepID=UPI00387E0499
MRDLSIQTRPVEALIPYARNSRTHSAGQVAQIAASIREFGWTNPVLVDGENGIIAGHGRVLAARKLGLTEVPCIEIRDMTEAQNAPTSSPTTSWPKTPDGTRNCWRSNSANSRPTASTSI